MKIGNSNNRTDTAKSRKLILGQLNKPRTANEIITRIHSIEVRSEKVKRRGWKFYAHLNKLFCQMEKCGIIEQIGTTKGPTGRIEKIWGFCEV